MLGRSWPLRRSAKASGRQDVVGAAHMRYFRRSPDSVADIPRWQIAEADHQLGQRPPLWCSWTLGRRWVRPGGRDRKASVGRDTCTEALWTFYHPLGLEACVRSLGSQLLSCRIPFGESEARCHQLQQAQGACVLFALRMRDASYLRTHSANGTECHVSSLRRTKCMDR